MLRRRARRARSRRDARRQPRSAARGRPDLDAVVALWREHANAGTLAINVKADGLDGMLAAALRETDPARSFVFDMSIPDALSYVRAGIPYFARHSEVEPEPALYADSVA